MKVLSIAKGVVRTLIWAIMAVLLLATGIILVLYSSWGQDILKDTLVKKFASEGGSGLQVSELRLNFPLKLSIAGISLVQKGDTMVMADTLKADVRLLPLLAGNVKIANARLINGSYQMGSPDSAMWLRISAAEIQLHPASFGLSDMGISLDDGYLRDASVDLVLRPLPSTSNDSTSESSGLTIDIKNLVTENLTYRMSMLPTIDSLGTNIPHGVLQNGRIDLNKQTVKLHNFLAQGLTVSYITPDSATIAATPVLPLDTATSSVPWTVTIDTINIKDGAALYTTRGVNPMPGLDFAFIQAQDMDLVITDFYNQATILSLPLKLHATERCGITLDASGTFAMDSTNMYFNNFQVETPITALKADGFMGVGDLMTDPWLPLELKAQGYCGVKDMGMMFPFLAAYLNVLPSDDPPILSLGVRGTSGSMMVDDMSLRLPGCATLGAKGIIRNAFVPDEIGGELHLSGHIINVKSIIKAFTTPDMNLAVPPMTLNGNVHLSPLDMGGKLSATTLGGRVAVDADFKRTSEGYDLKLMSDKFPIHAFLPNLGVGNLTMKCDAHGLGLDFMDRKTNAYIDAQIESMIYEGYDYHDINLNATLKDGQANVDVSVDTEDLNVEILAEGNLIGNTFEWKATLDGQQINMHALNLSSTPMYITGSIEADASYTPKTGNIDASIYVPSIFYKGDEDIEVTLSNLSLKFSADDSLTMASLHNRDLNAKIVANARLDSLSQRFVALSDIIDRQIRDREIKVDTLQKLLPPFTLDMIAGNDNLINDILKPQQMSIEHLSLLARNDSTISINSGILDYQSGNITLDTIRLDVSQQGDKMHILSTVDNAPGNMDNWAHIRLDGLLNQDRISMRINQQNIEHKTGFDLGAIAVVADSSVTARLFPLSPVIGYKKWSVNIDNYLYYNFFNHHIDANLKMKGDDSSLQLYTDHHHQIGHEEDVDSINTVTLNISDVHLADWIAFNPFAPPISGDLSANLNVSWDGGSAINGNGQVSLDNFFYDHKRVADLLVDLNVDTSLGGTVNAEASLNIDGQRTMALVGSLNNEDKDSPFSLDFKLIRFPLKIVNPFLPEDMAQLTGTLNGDMGISGSSTNPKINGKLNFDEAKIKVAMTNTSYAFSSVNIPVEDNIVKFSDFSIMGANENPLYINGTVDVRSFVDPRVDLRLSASNMMVVNTQKAAKNALIFGKAYMDLDASARGNLRFLAVNAKVDVLSGTNVTYILTESSDNLTTTGTADMVKFVNLNDTTAVVAADSINTENMLLMLDAQLNIQQGTSVTVDLFTGQRDKVQMAPTGYLTYSQSPISEGRMTGRININSGMVRYTLPVIGSEKVFEFDPNSYVVFNGDMLNPVLNIHADEETKVSVAQEGRNSRLVNFDIKVGITGTLEQMDVAFDLSTDDDISVANELQTMSPEQRANEAMNMLLYNMYTGPGNTQSGFAINPLYSFVESQINNWAADNIKGVDLSFGINQFDQTVNGSTSSAMSYSYQVSKSLFDDRFKIVVGGNYTTDANADENLAENLVNDISFEYFLNKQQTMVLRLFRHVGYESILEGEITQTGVGFVYRRKLDRLVNMLPKFLRPKQKKY